MMSLRSPSRSLPALLMAALLGTAMMFAVPADADIVPDGYKPVKLSIEVKVGGKVPEGRTLLLLNTWKGATELPAGKTVQVEWHPLHGKMQVVSATAEQRKAIDRIAQEDRSQERMAKMQARSTPCAEPFDGVRTVEDTEPYDEIRWHYDVALEDESCRGSLTKTAYLESGEVRKTTPSATPSAAPPDGSAETTTSPKAQPSKAAEMPPKATPPRPASSCALARTSRNASPLAAALLALAGALLTWRRRP